MASTIESPSSATRMIPGALSILRSRSRNPSAFVCTSALKSRAYQCVPAQVQRSPGTCVQPTARSGCRNTTSYAGRIRKKMRPPTSTTAKTRTVPIRLATTRWMSWRERRMSQ